ncbi:sulfurtransferase [Acidisoma cellulosilytica]|uniref:Sulfurtransferase n=1 Tax=Acidisoma cellulosilyticum TaxID=2802395 RepID=A0A964E4P5_9PROT|nr:rhodanese-like domain-containing protein [Acidisoma cellulosilyticum]MCB8881910.1 sulfurtransferase [Acidisoma cellulosilyticum]
MRADPSPLVEADWLAANLDAVVVLDCSVARIPGINGRTAFAPGGAAFTRGHIPGARFADVMQAFSDPDARYPFTCPTRAGFDSAAQALGLNADSRIVAYDNLGSAYAARLWCVFRAFGLTNIRVLNGGIGAWEAIGGAIETGEAAPVPVGTLSAQQNSTLFVDTDFVAEMIGHGTIPGQPLLCGLRDVQFRGDDSTDPRRGHIPTSLNLPFPDLLDADGRLTPERVEAALSKLGVGHDIAPVLYCGGGINAAGLALALSLVGIDDVKIYDDSMNGWRNTLSLPVAHEASHV